MRSYQLDGLNWLLRLHHYGINGILADEMGLGKTMQTVSLLGFLKAYRNISGPHLVIAPKSTVGNWMREMANWCPHLRTVKFQGDKDERKRIGNEELVAGEFDVCITSYEIAIREKSILSKFAFRYIVVDEAHRLKNENSVLSQCVRLYPSQNRLLLTGTPLQNNLHELWALLNFLLPDIFTRAEDFDTWFNLDGIDAQERDDIVARLHKVLRPFLLRRLKADVVQELPPKKEITLYTRLSALQRTLYKSILERDIDAVNDITGKVDRSRLLNIVMQLRKACNHPYLFDGVEDRSLDPFGEHVVSNCGKMIVLDKLLERMQKQGSRVLIFSQMTRVLDILEDFCSMRKYEYCRIDGSTAGEDREEAMLSFNAENSSKFIFLLSTRAGGLGINLATADIVVLFDSDWNPQMDLQAMDRAHRIGQKKNVFVYRFVTENSVEEAMVQRAMKKLHLDALVIQQGRLAEQAKAASKDELQAMIRFGADQQIRAVDLDDLTEEAIDVILAQGEERTDAFNKELKKKCENNVLSFSMDADDMHNYYKFEGEDFSGKTWKASNQFLELGPRQRKQEGYNENLYYRMTLHGGTAPKDSSGKREKKEKERSEFQFFDEKALHALWLKERGLTEDQYQDALNDAEVKNVSVMEVVPPVQEGALTEEEIAERERLLQEGFSDWKYREYRAFVNACERFGRTDMENIVAAVQEVNPAKTHEDVKSYSKVFWKRCKELSDYDKIIKQIEGGEEKLQKRAEAIHALEVKVGWYKNPWTDLEISYGPGRDKRWTEEEDRFLLCMTQKLGYGLWEELADEVFKAPEFRFDWWMKSRNVAELRRRVENLLKVIVKEVEDAEVKGPKKGKKRKAGEGQTTSGKKRRV
eukprot:Rmarinus@m.16471